MVEDHLHPAGRGPDVHDPGDHPKPHRVEISFKPDEDPMPDLEGSFQLPGGPKGYQAALPEEGYPIAELLGLGHVMGCEDDGDLLLLVYLLDEGSRLQRHIRVEARGRLVEEEDLGPVQDRLRERDPLFGAGGEGLELRVGVRFQLEGRDRLVDGFCEIPTVETVEHRRMGQVLPHG
jgi:hypothetical protein